MITNQLKRFHHLYFWAIFALLIVGSALISRVIPTSASGSPECTNGSMIIAPSSGSVITGVIPIQVYIPNYLSPTDVKILADDSFVGNAYAMPSGSGTWELEWDTASLGSENVNIKAHIFFSATTDDCFTNQVELIVENGNTNADLEIFVNREEWIGPTNVNVGLEVFAHMIGGTTGDTEVTNQAVITWTTDIGNIFGNHRFGEFSSGPIPGEGEVRVTVSYGGQTEHKTIDIVVLGQNEPSTYPYNGEDDEEGSKLNQNGEFEDFEDGMTSIDGDRLDDSAYGDEKLEDCFQLALGERFDEVFNGSGRFAYGDLNNVRTCLAARRFVLPANLAPVDPVKVRELRQSDRLKINEPRQARNNNGDDSGLILSGTAYPNSNLLLYVFSEPLVLTTQSDEDGNWTYVLEDPLEPGEHEVFVAVEEDSEFVRSDAYTFSLAQVASTEGNPSGLSLSLTTDTDLTIYIIAAAGTVVFGLIVFMSIIHRKTQLYHPHAPKPESHHGVSG